MSSDETSFEHFAPFSNRGELWKDIEPVPQFSDNVEILKINYSQQYREVNDYFRAILKKNEISKRAYDLTTELIELSATNYMAWYHRRLCLDTLNELDFKQELEWLDSITLDNQKNYQIWHHRKVILEKLSDPSHEKKMLNEVFKDEPKNFHAWCHRIWVVSRFNLFEGEMDYAESLLEEDVKNNSAWNYRHFLITYEHKGNLPNDVIQREIDYSFRQIQRAVDNECVFSYIRGLFKPLNNILRFPIIKQTLIKLKKVNEEFVQLHSLLLDYYIAEGSKEKVLETFDILSSLDHVRRKYWLWRKNYYQTV